MNIVLLSGGSGKRLWPLSNDIRSKQFLKLLQCSNGNYESMVQRICRQLRLSNKNADITIATSKSQVSLLRNQIGDMVDLCVEPYRRDTFSAICLACSYLYDIKGIGEKECIIVCPIDSYVEDEYFELFQKLENYVKEEGEGIVLLGIEPTYPSEKYGYILPERKAIVSKVCGFREKPDATTAAEYIEQGALWNGGVFAFQLGYLLKLAHEQIVFRDYQDLREKYEDLPAVSFDYAVVEKERSLKVVRYSGMWKDIGTWNTLSEAMEEATFGKVILSESCENTNVVNELNTPVLCMGLKNIVVAAGPEGVLVSDKHQSSFIKPYVDEIKQAVMFAEKSWGSLQILDEEEESRIIKIIVKPGKQLSYHSHEYRNERWTVVSGKGIVIKDGIERKVKEGDDVFIPAGCRHTVKAESELKIIEIQCGKDISVSDKEKYTL